MSKLGQLAKILCQLAYEFYSDQIAIIGVYGSVALNKQTDSSDLDMFAIVDENAESKIDWKFIFQNNQVSFWSMDWKKAEQIVRGKIKENPWVVAASIFLNNKLLYIRSEEDKQHFEGIRQNIKISLEEHIRIILSEYENLKGYINGIQQARNVMIS